MSNRISRRDMMKATAVGGAALAAHLAAVSAAEAQGEAEEPWPELPPVRIHKVYVGRTGGYMARPTAEKAKLDKHLEELAKKLGDVEFVGGETIPPDGTAEVAAKAAKADAMLVIYLSGHGGAAPVLGKLFETGKPAVLFFQPFGGHGWMYFQRWRKEGRKVVLLSTSDWSDLDRAVGLLRVPTRMAQTRILAVGPLRGTKAACTAEEVKKKLGAEILPVPNSRILEVARGIDIKLAEAEAQRYWIGQAQKIVEPKIPEIIESVRYSLAVRKVMIQEKAWAIASSRCMGNPRGCLTFSKLNDDGLVGACEGDIDSTLTMLLFGYAFGVPGFITDPVIDTAKNAMIHFHCTCATKMDGRRGKRLPFVIRNQTDTGGGVALQVANRIGQAVTCAKLVNLDTMLVCPGKIIETSTSPLACRTQFTQSVADARRLFLHWGTDVIQGGVMTLLHRVVFYGDYARRAEDLGALMGFKVLEEGCPPRTT